MTSPNEVPKSVIIFARACGVFGIIQSVLWIILYAFSMATYMNCSFLQRDNIAFQDLFGVIIHYFYFRQETCSKDDLGVELDDLQLSVVLQPDVIFIWSAIGVSFSSIWFIASIYLLTAVNKKTIKKAVLAIYIWCTSAALVITVDVAVGVLFGITYGEVTTVLMDYLTYYADNVDHNYFVDVQAYMYDIIRYGALLLMAISFKGFILLIINIYAASALFHKSYLLDDIMAAKTEPQRGEPIRAYGSSRRDPPSDLWHTAPTPSDFDINERASFARQPNHERVTSWTNQPTNVGSLPFTYLAEPRQIQHATSSPVISQNVPSWRRSNNFDPQPHVPAPDYSPVQTRKLKSALKNGY